MEQKLIQKKNRKVQNKPRFLKDKKRKKPLLQSLLEILLGTRVFRQHSNRVYMHVL